MNLEKWIEGSAERRRKYAYYLGLGYSEKAAAVFSALTYGNPWLAGLAGKLGGREMPGRLYDWLQAREEEDPEQAVLNWFDEESRPRGPGPARGRGNRSRKLAVFNENDGEDEHIMRSLVDRDFSGPAYSAKPAPDTESVPLPREAHRADPEDGQAAAPVFCEMEEQVSLSALIGEMDRLPRHFVSLKRTGIMEALATDEYEPIEEKDASDVLTEPTSTFRMTTNSASMGIVFNQLRTGRPVRLEQVRTEEILNAFDYDAEKPAGEKFAVSTELLPKKDGRKLLYVHVQAAEETREHQNVVLLLDVSGSMSGNTQTTQAAAAAVFSRLRPGDRISLVTYSSGDRTVLDGFEIREERDREELMGVLLGINVGGCTWGSAGITTAYAIGEKYFRPDWNNQVILITDGDLNFGITDKGGLQELIEEKKKGGLFLSVIGTGLWNYRDDKLETLSKHGNGTYCVVNSLEDVEEFIVRHYAALTSVVAKDVKAQVEFNPRFVRSYRLLGYENRRLNHADFKNDAVISEPYGSGGHGVAMYELEMRTDDGTRPDAGLKYQTPVLKESDELCTVSVRWKEPLGEKSTGIEVPVHDADNGTRNAQLAYFLCCLSGELRGSDRLDEYDREFLRVTLTSRLYRNFAGPNLEKLELLVDAFERRGERDADQESIWDFLL